MPDVTVVCTRQHLIPVVCVVVQFMLLAAFTPTMRTDYRDLNSFNPTDKEIVLPPPSITTA